MGIAELRPVVILWYETDVSEKAQRGELEKRIPTLERKCYLICIVPPLRISPSFASHEAYSERNVPTWWVQILAAHMYEVLRKVLELEFISGVSRSLISI